VSNTVEVEKKLEIQVDYVKCQECGEELEFILNSDSYGDLQIMVDRCECGESK